MAPFYGMLRAIPHKLGGVMVMFSAMGLLFLVPWLDNSPVRSMRYKGNYSRIALSLMVVSFVVLGYLGIHEQTPGKQIMAQGATFLYFAYFLGMPFYTRFESTQLLPEHIQ